jgi:hypothetical protein
LSPLLLLTQGNAREVFLRLRCDAGGLGTLGELFEAAALIQCAKVGPFPLILVGREFWEGLVEFANFMVGQGVFDRKDLVFARLVASPEEATELVLKSLPAAIRKHLKPPATRSGK